MVLTSVAAEPIGQVKTVQGTVTRTRQATAQPVAAGELLHAGNLLTTGAGSHCGLTLIDGSRFVLGPRSALRLEQFTWEATPRTGASRTHLSQGTAVISAGGIAASGATAMQVTTPRSVIAIGDTTLALEVHP